MKQTHRLVPCAVIVALIGAQALLVAAYIGHERTIYFWDHAMYFGMARQFYGLSAQSPSAGWAAFENSLAGNYNLVFALPSLISFELYGPSRLVFILTNYFVFFLAYEIAVACLLRRALGFSWRQALLISLISCMLIPPLWLPLLEGYPDIGAAACIVFAAGLFFDGPDKPRTIPHAVGLGFVLGAAVLLRRHFVYAALALLATAACFSLWEIWRAGKDRRRKTGRVFLYFACCGLGFVGILALAAPEFLRAALTTDYGQLYLSYRRPAFVFLRFALGGFGVGLLLVAAGGLIFLARAGAAGRKLVAFVVLYVLLWLVVWCLGPDQLGHHYILHALPLFVITGFTGWPVFFNRRSGGGKYFPAALLAFGLITNSAWALWFSSTGVWPNDNGTPGLFSAPRPPVVRSDYDEWLRLANYMRQSTRPGDRIMLVGSSFVFNLDLLHSIYKDILGMPAMALRFPKSPEIDHEEPAPFDVFASSDVYIVPEPAQYHLDPAGQRVVTAAANQFPPPPSRAALFHEDAAVFHLAGGVVARIWRRDAWTPGKLEDALEDIRRAGPQDANFAQDWAATILPLRAQIHTSPQGLTFAAGIFDPQWTRLDLFFGRPLTAGDYSLGLSAASNCGDLRFHLDVLTVDGRTKVAKDFAPVLMPGDVFQLFSIPKTPDGNYFLQLGLSVAAGTPCVAELKGLRLEKLP